MFAANLVEYFTRRAGASVHNIVQTLADAFFRISAGRKVEQTLVSFGVLYDSGRLPLHSEHHGPLGFLELFHKVTGTAAEGRQRLDITRNVQHRFAHIDSTFLGAERIPCLGGAENRLG
jgi:hypothetical protein